MRCRTMSETYDITTLISNHPKIIGVLFTLMFLLSQVGSVAAAANGVISGP